MTLIIFRERQSMNIHNHIKVIPDFPKPGINFYDIGSLIKDPAMFRSIVSAMSDDIKAYEPDMIMCIEARGFLFGSAIALNLGVGLGMVRKKGKLPGNIFSHNYALEYGQDTIEVQADYINQGTRIVLIDDILATGGTLSASESLVEQAGANVVCSACVIELEGLNGRTALKAPFHCLASLPA